jgi:hypothetical protein
MRLLASSWVGFAADELFGMRRARTLDCHRALNDRIEQCEAAKNIESEFGTQKALEYLVGERFLNFLVQRQTW